MTTPIDPALPPLSTSGGPEGITHLIDLGPCGWANLPLEQAVMVSMDLWPPYAFDVREACGIRWNWCDIRRFMAKTKRVGKCLMWEGAKSRGKGNTQWYGSFHTQGKTVRAHKFYGVAVLGLRPEPGEELDHECNDSLCVHVRVLSQPENQARIRRPTKQVLDLAKACDMSPAEVMKLPADKIATYARLLEVAEKINAGTHVPGVIFCKRTGVGKRIRRR